MTPLPGCTPTKPGACARPFFGIKPVILPLEAKEQVPTEIEGNSVSGVLCFKYPWPGMSRTIWGDHQRYLNVYMRPYPTYYFTGDGAVRDKDGDYWVTGRVDDVINVSGHRIGTAEVESALTSSDDDNPAEKPLLCSTAAVVAIEHPVKGQALYAYCILNPSHTSEDIVKDIKLRVRAEVGGFAVPDDIVIVNDVPKTRSGKTMRRLLRKIAEGVTDRSTFGDLSTLNPSADGSDPIDHIIARVKAYREKKEDAHRNKRQRTK